MPKHISSFQKIYFLPFWTVLGSEKQLSSPEDLNGIMIVRWPTGMQSLEKALDPQNCCQKRKPSKRMTGVTNPSQHRRKQLLVEWQGKTMSISALQNEEQKNIYLNFLY